MRLQIGAETVERWGKFAETVGRGRDPEALLAEMMLAYREFFLRIV